MAEYIEREQAIKIAESYGLKNGSALGRHSGTADCIAEAILIIPPADVTPVRNGRWIEYTKVIIPEPYNKWEQAWKCSECGFDDGFVAYNYCPNCGAKMDGGADNE